MNLKIGGFIGLSAILVFYAILYMATKPAEPCDENCEKFREVQLELQKNRPFIYAAYQCKDSNLCVAVRDSIMPYSWNLLADTACIYLKTQSLFNYKVTILKMSLVDTMGKQQCP